MSADYWSLTFDANGNILNQDAAALVSEIVASATSNLFVLSHGLGQHPAGCCQGAETNGCPHRHRTGAGRGGDRDQGCSH